MAEESTLFVYGAPLVGVLLVAVGIGAAVPGAYALVQDQLVDCGAPTIAVDSPAETERRFGASGPAVDRLAFEDLSESEQSAFLAARSDPQGEAHVDGPFPNYPTVLNGTIVTYEGRAYYTTVVAENPCFEAAPLQFPLGVFAIALGIVGILTPPVYRKLIRLEEGAGW